MDRREALRLLATGAALQLTPGSLRVVLREARALLADQAIPRTLNEHQYATVKAMAEKIIPRTDTPGATDVGAVDFIDLILTEWYDETERSHFLHGLAEVDSRSRELFGKNFVDSSPVQQSDILVDLGAKMVANAGLGRTRSADREFVIDPDFYSRFRRLTLTAYYTSEAGATKELNFEIIPDRYQGCETARRNQETIKQP